MITYHSLLTAATAVNFSLDLTRLASKAISKEDGTLFSAGLELVFDVPYIYTTPPLAAVVYAYALLCTRASGHVQTVVTSALTVVLGSVFCSIAIWGSYKIVASMIMGIQLLLFTYLKYLKKVM